MLSKSILIAAMALAISGCATNEQSGRLIGAAAGGIIGNQVGGGTGRVAATAIGAVIGSEAGGKVGQTVDQAGHPPQPSVRVEPRPYIVERHYIHSPVSVCRERYHMAVNLCDSKFRNDPYYNRQYLNQCIENAKYRFESCVRQ